jgi:ElaB/YqjD/DUF883 family membrane-anchored ribosome-binding protein
MSDENTTNPNVESACGACSPDEVLRRAKAEMEKAHAFYEHVREQAAERLKDVRETSVGDVVHCTLATVKRHPGASLTVAALLGFLLGRLIRR